MAITRATKRPELGSSSLSRRRCSVAERQRCTVTPPRLAGSILALVVSYSLVVAPAVAQTFRFTPSISIDETFTDNVHFDPRADAKSDFITQITPSLTVSEAGSRLKFSGYVLLPILVYARTGAGNDSVQPQVNLQGSAEVVEKLLFVDSAIYVQQQYVSPFAARPLTFTTQNGNGFTTESYNVTPYFRGGSGNYDYDVRDKNIWTFTNGVVGSSPTSSYTNEIVGTASRKPTPIGWTIDVDRSDVKFPDEAALVTQLGRARALWEVDPQVELSAGGGYEDNRYTLASYKDAIYNVGFRWRPTERTLASGDWEHRFFGASYHFAFDHRTPLSVWNLRASRDTATYPQQLATLPPGSSISVLLNQLLLSSIPDPVARQSYIDQLIANGGLPLLTSGPINLFTQQVLLQENASASLGLLGARNNAFFSVFRLRSEPIAGTGVALEGALSSLSNNTQTGGSLVWTHNLTSALALNTSADLLRTVANAPFEGKTTQGSLRLTLTAPLSANTSAYVGGRYQRLRSDITKDYDEAAVYVGMSHVFR
jgi:uncharacterized protein (PEP-CTERM system associated)